MIEYEKLVMELRKMTSNERIKFMEERRMAAGDPRGEKLAAYKEENKTAKKGQIVFAGSSLMEWFPINQLLAEHGDDTVIYNRGVAGSVTAEYYNWLDFCVIDLQPRRIFINIGTNDMNDPKLKLEDLITRYEMIIDKITDGVPGIEIYTMAYYPVNPDAAFEENRQSLIEVRSNEKIRQANRLVEEMSRRRGLKYIDINGKITDAQGKMKIDYCIDGVHINENGYRVIYDDIMRYVKETEWK